MAIPQSDGSIILTTKVDDAGIKDYIKNAKKSAAELGKESVKAAQQSAQAQGQDGLSEWQVRYPVH